MATTPAETEAVFRRLGAAIHRRCLKILRRESEAADAAQEVFVRLLRHRDRMPPEPEQLRWAYAIATRICLNRIRDSSWESVAEGDELPGEALLATPPSGQEWVADRQLAARLLAAHDEDSRAIAWLVLVDGHTQEEAGALLGLSRKTVGKKLAAFLESARRMLAADRLPEKVA